jgi:glucose/arabinose dehydrogenase
VRAVPVLSIGVAGAALLAILGACSDGDQAPPATQAQEQTSTTTIVPGVTKDSEASTPTPTMVAPTPVPSAAPGQPPAVELVDAFPGLGELDRPIELINASDREGEFLVALQDGRILSILNLENAPDARTILDIRDEVSRDGNEEGLLGIAIRAGEVDGDSGEIFLYYSVEDGPRRTRLARMNWTRVDGRLAIDPETELVILEVPQPFSNHNGGKVAFGPDGMLYLALGDGGSGGDPQGNGQNLGTLLGSILRLDVSAASVDEPYRIPADNPFVGTAGARGEIWAYGLRNPWRFSFDSQWRLWAGDVGQGQFEEINLVQGGGNYGWNVVEGNECFGSAGCDIGAYLAPVSVYGHSRGDCSVTGGVVHQSKDSEALQGWYFFADFCSGRVRAFHPDAAEAETFVVIDSGPPIAAITAISRGVLLLSFDGTIYRLAED